MKDEIKKALDEYRAAYMNAAENELRYQTPDCFTACALIDNLTAEDIRQRTAAEFAPPPTPPEVELSEEERRLDDIGLDELHREEIRDFTKLHRKTQATLDKALAGVTAERDKLKAENKRLRAKLAAALAQLKAARRETGTED